MQSNKYVNTWTTWTVPLSMALLVPKNSQCLRLARSFQFCLEYHHPTPNPNWNPKQLQPFNTSFTDEFYGYEGGKISPGLLKPWHLKLTIFPRKFQFHFVIKHFFLSSLGQEMKACVGIEQSLLKTFIDVFRLKWKRRKEEEVERKKSLHFIFFSPGSLFDFRLPFL